MNMSHAAKHYPSQDPIAKLRQYMALRGFSPRTVKAYLQYISALLAYTSKDIRTITTQDIKDYLAHLADTGASTSTLNLAYSALKLYFATVLGKRLLTSIPRTKRGRRLPTVLSQQEAAALVVAAGNPKHRCSANWRT